MVNPSSLVQRENLKPQINRGLETLTPIFERLEASVFGIGVPLLLPNARTNQLRASAFKPTADYIRSALVGVTTAELESFRLQLSNERKPSAALDRLDFVRLTFLERFGMPLTIAAILLAGITVPNVLGLTALTGAIVKISLPCFGLCLILASRSRDGFRRYSFVRLIQQEIARRSGGAPDEAPIPFTVCRSPN